MPLEGGWEESDFFKSDSFCLGGGVSARFKVAVELEFI